MICGKDSSIIYTLPIRLTFHLIVLLFSSLITEFGKMKCPTLTTFTLRIVCPILPKHSKDHLHTGLGPCVKVGQGFSGLSRPAQEGLSSSNKTVGRSSPRMPSFFCCFFRKFVIHQRMDSFYISSIYFEVNKHMIF